MKGIIFNLAEEVLTDAHGTDAWDDVLERADLSGAYTSLGSYPDDDLHRIVRAGAAALDSTPSDVLRAVGTGAIPPLAERYPQFFSGHSSTRSFVLTLNEIIHPEVLKLYPGAEVPDFSFDGTDDEVLILRYRSARKLCALAEGFLEGAAAHYGETITTLHETCMHDGEDSCVIRCTFVAA